MAKARWTVLTYLAAHNNLAMLGKMSLNQILKVGSTESVVHGMLYDGPGEGGRYIVGAPGTVSEQELFEEFNSGDPDELIKTATWLFRKCPAERYGLVLWSHGTGWMPSEITQVAAEARPDAANDAESTERAGTPGSLALFRTTIRTLQKPPKRTERAILFDDGSGQSLDTLELQRVLSTIAGAVGQPLEFLGMDACLMASVEVAYEIQPSVRSYVASSELVPGHSWPYAAIYGALGSQPEMSGAELATRVVEDYVQFYSQQPPAAGDVTKVALDLRKIDAISRPIRELADALTADMANHAALIWAAQRTAMDHETNGAKRKPNKFDFHLWDLGSFAAGLAANANASEPVRRAATAVLAALKTTVLAEGHRGAWFDGTSGVTVYLVPPSVQRISPYYGQLAFTKQTHWLEMLTKYHELA